MPTTHSEDVGVLLCLDVRGAVKEANQGFILLFASDTQQRPAVPPSPNGSLADPPAPLDFIWPLAGQGTGLHWCLCQSLVTLGAAPSNVAYPAPARAIPREALPASSMGRAALPIVASSHCGGGRAETSGRTSHNPKLLPAGSWDGGTQ